MSWPSSSLEASRIAASPKRERSPIEATHRTGIDPVSGVIDRNRCGQQGLERTEWKGSVAPEAERGWGRSTSGERLGGRPRRGRNHYTKMGPKTTATIDISLSRMLSEGPEVSLNGSPTVSPTTAALWASEPLPPKWPSSMYFLALSQAPPALAIMIAIMEPAAMEPISRPPSASAPITAPTTIGTTTARSPGMIISRRAPSVEMATARV